MSFPRARSRRSPARAGEVARLLREHLRRARGPVDRRAVGPRGPRDAGPEVVGARARVEDGAEREREIEGRAGAPARRVRGERQGEEAPRRAAGDAEGRAEAPARLGDVREVAQRRRVRMRRALAEGRVDDHQAPRREGPRLGRVALAVARREAAAVREHRDAERRARGVRRHRRAVEGLVALRRRVGARVDDGAVAHLQRVAEDAHGEGLVRGGAGAVLLRGADAGAEDGGHERRTRAHARIGSPALQLVAALARRRRGDSATQLGLGAKAHSSSSQQQLTARKPCAKTQVQDCGNLL